MSRGQWAEEWIENKCRRLGASGAAFIRRVTPPAKVVSDRGRTRAFLQAAGLPDFVGFLPGGRGILFDVKSTHEAAWAWAEGRNLRTKERQIADLERAGRDYGVVAGLLIGFMPRSGEMPTWAWIPWGVLRRVASGRWRPAALWAAGASVWQEASGEADEEMLARMVGGLKE